MIVLYIAIGIVIGWIACIVLFAGDRADMEWKINFLESELKKLKKLLEE